MQHTRNPDSTDLTGEYGDTIAMATSSVIGTVVLIMQGPSTAASMRLTAREARLLAADLLLLAERSGG
jgi:hypothetical protein